MKKAIAILLAFLLTGSLVLFCVTFVGRQVLLPAMGEEAAPVSDSLIREEQRLVRERITAMAELYHFEAEPVISVINEDTLRELNQQASRWWSSLLKDGKTGEEPEWNTTELEEVLESDAILNQMEDKDRAEYLRVSAIQDIRKSVIRLVLPMRQKIIFLGMQEADKRIDILNLIAFFMGTPWAALALSALLAGLIVLLGSRKFDGAIQYIGSAMGAAALVLIALIILYLCAGIQPMIREASASLAVQYQSVESGMLIRGGILAAALAAGCVLCLAACGKSGKEA
jgi:hypothetical protein